MLRTFSISIIIGAKTFLFDIFVCQPFGEIVMIQLKKRPGTGESKGFGFIKFADKEVEKKVKAGEIP